MKLSFTKMQGCANDYIYLDCRASGVPENIAALSEKLSRRHFSIGADQSEPEPLIARLQLDSAVGVSFQKAQRVKALHPAKLLYGGDRLGQHDSFSGHGLILPS